MNEERYEIRYNVTADDYVDLNEIVLGRALWIFRYGGVVAAAVGLVVLVAESYLDMDNFLGLLLF